MGDEKIDDKILQANIDVHKKESSFYDPLHLEINNWFENKKTNEDIRFTKNQIKKKGYNVLDIGCGTGNILLRFLDANKVVGLDISKEMLTVLERKLGRINSRNVSLVTLDIDTFIEKADKKFDVISINSVLHHLPHPDQTISRVLDIVNAHGLVYIAHEPLAKNCSHETPLSRLLKIVDRIASNIYWLTKSPSIIFNKVDHSLSDYHRGLEPDLIVAKLKEKNFKMIKYEKYTSNRIGLISLINNKIGTKTAFKIIAQKQI